MPDDLYATLGVARDVDAEQIRAAYRKLAKRHHPDLNPGNKAAEAKFKEISAANEILSDPEKRGRYDRGEIDASGAERAPQRPTYQDYAEGPTGRRYSHSGSAEQDYSDIFADFFGRGGPAEMRMRGDDRPYTLRVSFLDAANGATTRLTLPDGKPLDVRIPPGIDNEQVLRLKGQGDPGRGEAPAGDALIRIQIEPHRFFQRDGRDILLEFPVTLAEAVLGARKNVPTVSGRVAMTIPAKSNTGTKLRLRGRGIPAHGNQPAGDQIISLKVVLDPNDEGLAKFLRERSDAPKFDPSADLMETS
jgi:DnaJ-class molecular chaperone